MNDIDKIIELSKNDSSFLFYRKYLKNDESLKKHVNDAIVNEPWFETERLYMICVSRGILNPVKCRCGNSIKVRNALKGKRFCSCACSNGDEGKKEKERETNRRKYGCDYSTQSNEINRKRRNTMIEHYGVAVPLKSNDIREKAKATVRSRYGVDNVMQSDEIKERLFATNIERYGCEHAIQNDEVRAKAIGTTLLHYGVENPSQSDIVRKRVIDTNMERYGVENAMMLESVQEKVRSTNLERYGVENASQSDEIRQRVKDTNLERYGVENVFQCDEIKSKSKMTCVERYGVEHPAQNEEILKKMKETCLERYDSETFSNSNENYRRIFSSLISRISDYVRPLFDYSEYDGRNSDKELEWECVKCGTHFKQKIMTTDVSENYRRVPRCPKCYPFDSSVGTSIEEKEVKDYVESIYSGRIIENDSKIINPYELDIYMPERNIAIEFDGLYWHSEACGKDSTYHLKKTEMCSKIGVQLIHIFEDEWKNKKDIVKDRIASIIGQQIKKVYARKCKIIEISALVANEFLDANHIQGKDNSPIRYGLVFNEEIVSVMTFEKPRFNNNYDWELVRFASKIGVSVVGGASKLLSYFRCQHQGTIVSYADRRYSIGKLYETLGFKNIDSSSPNYFYVKKDKRVSRYQCQKHKLPALLGDGFDEKLSETENMVLNGWTKVFDCGNFVYVLE